jgi:hypothetical protein
MEPSPYPNLNPSLRSFITGEKRCQNTINMGT